MIFASRGSGGPHPGFQWKVRIFFLGAVLALVGIGVDSSFLVGSALVVLIGGMAVAFFLGRTPAREEDGSSSISHGRGGYDDFG